MSYASNNLSVCEVDANSGALAILTAGACEVTVTAAATANYVAATADFTLTVNPVGTLALNVGIIAGDDSINIAEKMAGFAISGDTGTVAGVTVTLTLGTATLAAATSAGDGTWTVAVPADAAYVTGAGVTVTVTAVKNGHDDATPLSRSLTVDLSAPTPPGYTLPAGYALTVGTASTALSPAGGADIAAYAAPGLPAGLTIDTSSGVISGTPTTVAADPAGVTVTVTDSAGNPASVTLTFPAVARGAQDLSGFGYSETSVALSATAPTLTAPTGALTTLAYTAAPVAVCTVDAGSGALTLTGVGECVISVSAAANANYDAATASFTLTVGADPALPLTLAAVADDDTINIARWTAGFSVSGATGDVAGASVAVTLGGTALAAVTSAGDGAWSVAVPAAAAYVTGTEVALTVSASKARYTAATVNRSLTVDLVAPTLSYAAPTTLTVGTAISAMAPTTSDTDIKSYAATDLPPGLTIDAASGAISGTPDTARDAAQDATVTLTDNAGNPTPVTVTFPAVTKGAQVLSGFAYSQTNIVFGATAPTLTAPSGARGGLSYASNNLSVCEADANSGALAILTAGACEVTVTAAATANYVAATADFTLTVNPVGTLALNVGIIAGDDSINIAEKMAGFAISGDTGTVAGVTVTLTLGTATLAAATSAGDGTWTVAVPADAAYVTGAGVTVTVTAVKNGHDDATALSRSLTVDLSAPTPPGYTLPAGYALTVGTASTALSPAGGADIAAYAAPGLPAGLTIDTSSGVISGTPTTVAADPAGVTVTVTDSAGNPASVTLTFPAVARGAQDLSGFGYSETSVALSATAPTLTAPTGALTTLAYTAAPVAVCTVDAGSGALTLTGVGECVISVSAAANANYDAATASFTLTVGADPALPLTLAAVADDDTINIARWTAGFSVSGATGDVAGASVAVTLGGTALAAVTSAGDGAWSVAVPAAAAYVTGTEVALTVSASKARYTAATVNRSLTVDLVAPTLSYAAPTTLTVGTAISAMAPTTSDTDIKSYAATDLPPGLTIDAASGAISGTPDTARDAAQAATVTLTDNAGNPTPVTVTFPAVDRGEQVLSGFAYSQTSIVFGATAPTLTAPSGARGDLSYASNNLSVCEVDANSGALAILTAGACEVTVTAAATANYAAATADFTLTVNPVGTLALNVGIIAGDDSINIAEKMAGFAISGDTGTVAGVTVTLTLGTATLAAATSAGDGTWTVAVPADAAYVTGAGVTVTVTAVKNGHDDATAVNRSLVVDLSAPTPPGYTLPAGYALTVGTASTALSPAGGADIAAYAAPGLPAGLTIDTSSGVISGTPTTVAADPAGVTVTVTDSAGNPASVTLTFPAVARGAQDLSGFGYSETSVALSATAPTLTAPTGALTTLAYTAAPVAVCTVDAGSGALTLTGVGECVISVSAAANANYDAATASFTLTVGADPALPLTLAAVADDDTINIARWTAGFSVSGATGDVAGASVAVTLGGTALAAVTSAGDGAWSVAVPAAAAYVTGTEVALTVSASKARYTAATVNRSLTVDLVAPTLSYAAPTTLTVGTAISAMAPTTSDTDIKSYAATDLPPGLTIDAASGAISGTPDTARDAAQDATVTLTDNAGNPTPVTVTFPAVTKGAQVLSGFAYSQTNIVFGATAPTLTAPSGARGGLSYASNNLSVCEVDANSGALAILTAGACEVTVTAAATANYAAATADFTLTVNPVGTLALNVGIIAGDDSINIAEKMAGFAISGDTGTVAGVTVTLTLGTATLAAATSAGDGTWTVAVPADAAYVTGAGVTVTVTAVKNGHDDATAVSRSLTVDLSAPTPPGYTLPAGYALTVGTASTALSPAGGADIAAYAAPGLPAGLTIDTSSGVISGTPTTVAADPAGVTVTVTDSAGNPASVTLTFPAVARGAQDLSGFGYSETSVALSATPPTLTAPTGALTTLAYTAAPVAVCTVDAGSGALTLTGVGECVISVSAAANANYDAATASFTLTVGADPALPLTLAAVADDDTINIARWTAGFSVSGATGDVAGASVAVTLGGTALAAVTSAADGAWSVAVPAAAAYVTGTEVALTVSASKARYTAATVNRSLTVDLVAPTLSYAAPTTLTVGTAISAMAPTTSDTDIKSYAATDLPPGLTIDAASGAISGTPDTARDAAQDATVTLTDNAGNPTPVTVTFPAVTKGAQVLSGFAYSQTNIVFGATAPTLTAPSGARGGLSYASNNLSVCEADANSGALAILTAGACEVTVTAAATANYAAATADFTLTVNPVGTLALNVGIIAGDDSINIAEKMAGFAISGDTGTVAGVTVTLTLGTATLAAATSAGDGTWTVAVPADAAYVTGAGVTVTVTAVKNGHDDATAVSRSLTVDLSAPTPPGYTLPAGYALTVGTASTALSPAGGADIAAYAAPGLPAGLTIDTSSGVISGTPTTVAADPAGVTVTVTDSAGNPASVTLTFPAVARGAQDLSGFGYSETSVALSATAPTLTAPTGALTTLAYTAAPVAVCTVDAGSGALTLTGVGECVISVSAAANANYDAATASFTLTVGADPALPLTLAAVADDDTINIARWTAGFSVSGATGDVAGASVAVTLGGTALAAVTSAGDGAWSVAVPAAAAYVTGTEVALTVSASKARYTAATVNRSLTVDLVAPTLSYAAPTTLTVGTAISAMAPTTSDTDIKSYAATDLPPGLTIDAASGAISGTPDTARDAAQDATVTLTDNAGNPTPVTVTFPAVTKGAQVLSGFAYSQTNIVFGATAPTLTAPSGARGGLSYASNNLSVCEADANSGALAILTAGACEVTVTAAATANYVAATADFTLTVNPVGTLALNVGIIAGDDSINIAEKMAGFAISGDTGTVAGVTVTLTLGTATLAAATSAGDGTWTVAVPADAAYVTGAGVTVTVTAVKNGHDDATPLSRSLTVDLSAPTPPGYTLPAGYALTVGTASTALSPAGGADIAAYAAPGLPAGLTIDTSSGVISGTPTTVAADPAGVTVTVTDSAGNPASVTLTFPAVARGAQDLSGFGYSETSVALSATAPTLTAPTGALTTLAYTAAPVAVCTVDAGSGALTLTGVGECVISVSAAANANYDAATASFTLTVGADPALPLTLAAVADDDTINIARWTAGFSVSGATGSVAGASVAVTLGGTALAAVTSAADGAWSLAVPAAAAYVTGTEVALTVSASKARYTAATVNRSLTVDLVAPTLSYAAPTTLTVGTAISAMAPTTSDTDIKSYAATDLPPGLDINAASGAISGTPDTARATEQAATVTLTDNADNPTPVTVTFPAVDRGEQVLSGFAYSQTSIVFGATAPTLTAPSGARGDLSYASNNLSVCEVDANSGALAILTAGACEVTVTAAATANYAAATADFTLTVNPVGTLALNVGIIAGDDSINIAEQAAGFAISGDTGTAAGVAVTVMIGTETLTATSAIVSPATDATWSVAVPADAAYVSGAGVTVTVTAAKNGHDAATAVNRSLVVDLSAPAVSYTAPASLTVGAAISAMAPTTSATDIATYSAAALPPGLDIDAASGVISGAPTTAGNTTQDPSVTVTDNAGNTGRATVNFPLVAEEQIQVEIHGELFIITVTHRPAHVSVGVNALSAEQMEAQVPPANVVFSTPPVYIDVNGLMTGEEVHFCMPRGNVPAGHIATIYTAGMDDGSQPSHWSEVGNADYPDMLKVCAIASSFSPHRVGYRSTQESVRAIALAVRASPARFAELGDIITFTYTVTNDGTETLAGPASIDDAVVAGVVCDAPPAGGLESGASLSCTGEYTVTQADLDAQRLVSRATAALDGVSSQVTPTTVLLRTANNQLPRLSVSDVRVAEDAGSLTFSVRLSVAAAEEVTVDYATGAGTARRSFDYSHVSGTLRFDVGESEKRVEVPVWDDESVEEDESFILTLSNPVNAGFDRATATGWIIDNDTRYLLTRHASAAEGAGQMVFKVLLAPVSDQTVTLDWATADASAAAGADYTPARGTLTFSPGEVEKTVRVPVIDDALDEDKESFTVRYSDPVNARLWRGNSMTGWIYDNDERAIRVAPQTLQVDEGTTGRYTVVLATQPTGNVTVVVTTDAAGVQLAPQQLRFDADNWSRPQAVDVTTPADTDMFDADRVLMHTASGGDYGGMQVWQELSIKDTDKPDDMPGEAPIIHPVDAPGVLDD